MKIILKNSLFAAIVFSIMYVILYFIDPRLNFDFNISVITMTIVYMFFMYRAAKQEKERLEGSLKFGEAFLASYSTFALASFISIFFTFLVFKLDPSMIDIVNEENIKNAESMWRMAGMSEEEIALNLENQSDGMFNNMSIGTLIIGWLGNIVSFGLIFALIISFIAKDKNA